MNYHFHLQVTQCSNFIRVSFIDCYFKFECIHEVLLVHLWQFRCNFYSKLQDFDSLIWCISQNHYCFLNKISLEWTNFLINHWIALYRFFSFILNHFPKLWNILLSTQYLLILLCLIDPIKIHQWFIFSRIPQSDSFQIFCSNLTKKYHSNHNILLQDSNICLGNDPLAYH